LLREAECVLPADVLKALGDALVRETSEVSRSQLLVIMDNVRKAAERTVPMCQDTGVPVFFIKGRHDHRIEAAIKTALARATREIPLRPNSVDPVTRTNSGDNLGPGMPPVHFEPQDTDHLDIAVLPKGAGSENWSALRMLNPSDGLEGVRRFVLECVVKAGSRPCPPIVVGVGLGGTADVAMGLSKKALLRPLDLHNPDPVMADMESALLGHINSLGLGPMGLGGSTTALGVLMEKVNCHTASLPVAVSLNCWADRRALARIFPDGRVIFSQGGFR